MSDDVKLPTSNFPNSQAHTQSRRFYLLVAPIYTLLAPSLMFRLYILPIFKLDPFAGR